MERLPAVISILPNRRIWDIMLVLARTNRPLGCVSAGRVS